MEITRIRKIQMVDLVSQYQKIKPEIDKAVIEVIESARFIKGPAVQEFEKALAEYLNVKHVVACANGTDALQIALMALDLKPGDEIIVPSFTYVATAEVMGLLNLKPIMVDVDPSTFNITADIVKEAITPNTKVIVPVHLYGQSSDMEDIITLAKKHNITVIEDNAQAIGADYTFRNGSVQKTGTIGNIGTTSFFPSKNLGCFGDGGAMFTNDDELALKLRMIANHGQKKKYHHSVIGVNSRLDTLQAAVLNIKLKHLDTYCKERQKVALRYDEAFKDIESITVPIRQANSTHVFHQYTMRITNGKRDELKEYLKERGIPSMVYYPIPLYNQEAFLSYVDKGMTLPVTEKLCEQVISLPIHTEMDIETQEYIINTLKEFFK
jgi:dTDP-4-amino-4,6-dideoxygalactose transaminase